MGDGGQTRTKERSNSAVKQVVSCPVFPKSSPHAPFPLPRGVRAPRSLSPLLTSRRGFIHPRQTSPLRFERETLREMAKC